MLLGLCPKIVFTNNKGDLVVQNGGAFLASAAEDVDLSQEPRFDKAYLAVSGLYTGTYTPYGGVYRLGGGTVAMVWTNRVLLSIRELC